MHWAFLLVIAAAIGFGVRYAYWHHRERMRQLRGHRPRKFAIFGIGELRYQDRFDVE